MWETVELREIRVFLTLADELHFGRSAERLGLTQSRVSQSLRELEAKIGGRLLHRTSRSVALTPLGVRFRDTTAPAYEQLRDALVQASVATAGPAGTVRVALISAPSAGPHLIPICRTYEARHPGTRVEVEEVPLGDPFGPLRRREADVMATYLPHDQPDLAVGPTLSVQRRVLAVAADHPLAQRDEVSIEDVADYRFAPIDALFPGALADVLFPRKTPGGRSIGRIRSRIADRARADRGRANTELFYMVARGEVVHPTVESMTDQWGELAIVCVPIRDLPPARSALVWPRRAATAEARRFVGVAREVLRATRRGYPREASNKGG